MDDSTPQIAWDTTWQSAVDHFGELNSDSMRAMTQLVATLSQLPEVRGLFAIPSMTTLRISPYSCCPDWFDGRFITVDANGPDAVTIRVATHGHDSKPQRVDCPFADAAAMIARLCHDQM